jgi:DNA-binding beta-propeller fold protein YncE
MKKKNTTERRLSSLAAALLISVFAAAFWSCDTANSNGGGPRLVYISDTGSATISVIDLDLLEKVEVIDLTETFEGSASQSHFFEVTKDGKYIWVGERQGSGDGKILVVDIETKEVVKEFNVGAAIGQTLSRNGKWVFAVSSGKGTVDEVDYNNVINVFDVKNQTHLGTIPHGSAPHVLETTPDSKTLWTTNAGGGKLISYDISGLPNTVPQTPKKEIDVKQKLITSGDIAENDTLSFHALALHNGYGIVGSSNLVSGGGDIVVDLESGDVVARVPGRPHNYDISPDKKYLLSGESNAPDCEEAAYLPEHNHAVTGPIVRVINIEALSSPSPDYDTIQVEGTIDSGAWDYGGISHQAYDPTGQYILVTTTTQGTSDGIVLVVNAATLEFVEAIPVGRSPHGINVPGAGR